MTQKESYCHNNVYVIDSSLVPSGSIAQNYVQLNYTIKRGWYKLHHFHSTFNMDHTVNFMLHEDTYKPVDGTSGRRYSFAMYNLNGYNFWQDEYSVIYLDRDRLQLNFEIRDRTGTLISFGGADTWTLVLKSVPEIYHH